MKAVKNKATIIITFTEYQEKDSFEIDVTTTNRIPVDGALLILTLAISHMEQFSDAYLDPTSDDELEVEI